MALNSAVGRAMAVQVKRARRDQTPQDVIDDLRVELAQVKRERDIALAEVERLNAENDTLAVKAHRARKVTSNGDTATGKFHGGVEYVNQIEAAALLKVEQYQISRWVAAKKFEMMTVPGIKKQQIVRSSLVKPARGTPGRKKK